MLKKYFMLALTYLPNWVILRGKANLGLSKGNNINSLASTFKVYSKTSKRIKNLDNKFENVYTDRRSSSILISDLHEKVQNRCQSDAFRLRGKKMQFNMFEKFERLTGDRHVHVLKTVKTCIISHYPVARADWYPQQNQSGHQFSSMKLPVTRSWWPKNYLGMSWKLISR